MSIFTIYELHYTDSLLRGGPSNYTLYGTYRTLGAAMADRQIVSGLTIVKVDRSF